MPIKTFDRQNVKQFDAAVRAALYKVCQEFGLTAPAVSGRWDPARMTMKVTVVAPDGNNTLIMSLAGMHGLDPTRIGPRGEKLVDYNGRAHAYPWIYTMGNKRYKCSDAVAHRLFGKVA